MNYQLLKSSIKTAIHSAKIALRCESKHLQKLRAQKAAHCNPAGHFRDWLELFHEKLNPTLYLEIGISKGTTLALARGNTRCIGIDPKIKISKQLIAPTRVYKMESDQFFVSPWARCLNRDIDLAFIDGRHEYGQAVRDINNVLLHSHEKTVILVHDIVPFDPKSAETMSVSTTGLWAGDVYKILPFLYDTVKDVEYTVIRAFPTGILVMSNLGPRALDGTTVNKKQFGKYQALSLDEFYEKWLPRFRTCFKTSRCCSQFGE